MGSHISCLSQSTLFTWLPRGEQEEKYKVVVYRIIWSKHGCSHGSSTHLLKLRTWTRHSNISWQKKRAKPHKSKYSNLNLSLAMVNYLRKDEPHLATYLKSQLKIRKIQNCDFKQKKEWFIKPLQGQGWNETHVYHVCFHQGHGSKWFYWRMIWIAYVLCTNLLITLFYRHDH